jgi:hypothetical protein
VDYVELSGGDEVIGALDFDRWMVSGGGRKV